MKLLYRHIESLPRLAWCARMEKFSDVVEVFHGSWVETCDTFFVEGVWDGPFAQGSFGDAYLMGSGGKISDQGILFCTPYHSHERLHFFSGDSRLFVSPSLSFILNMAGQELDIKHIPYHAQLIEMLYGYDHHVGVIPLSSGRDMKIIHFRNILVDRALNITVVDKRSSPEFLSYEDYRQYLVDRLKLYFANASSEHRKVRYDVISTISTGYDSPACSALAFDAGCRNAVTFKTSRAGYDRIEHGDSGKNIGEILGLSVEEYARNSYLTAEGTPEAEFVACGDLGQDFEMCAFEKAWEQKVVILGDHGDQLWDPDRQRKHIETKLWRYDTGGDCLVEFRTRVGFIPLRPIFVGALSHPSIHRITKSKEMIPWYLGNKYDRPIARRIIEEKGVPRELFARRKKNISILLNRDDRLQPQMKPESFSSFLNFYLQHRQIRGAFKQKIYEILFRAYHLCYGLISIPNKLFTRFGIPVLIPNIVPHKFSQPPGMPSFLVHWGIAKIRDRYHTEPQKSPLAKNAAHM